MPKITFTQAGYEKAQKELADYKFQRIDAIEHLKKSRELGDLKENGYYQASRAKVNHIDRQIRQLTYNLKYAVVSDTHSGDTVGIGAAVTIQDGEKTYVYTIVGDTEADSLEGKISSNSPLGEALFGRKAGETVDFQAPKGVIRYKILTVR